MTRKWTAVAVALLAVILCAAALAVSAQHHADGSGRLQQRTADADFDDAQADKPPAGKDESARADAAQHTATVRVAGQLL